VVLVELMVLLVGLMMPMKFLALEELVGSLELKLD
jgi:hypothetical protein